MKQFAAEVLANEPVAEGYFEMRFAWPQATPPLPGQFISVKSFGTTDLVLRRPFAVADYGSEVAAIIFQKKGPATAMLAGLRAGDSIDVIGPLGNTFPDPGERRPVLVGGGVGLGPILYFGNWLADRGKRPLVVLGFRCSALVPDLAARCRFRAVVCTDDGSEGETGTVIDYLRALPGDELSGSTVYACGPERMMAGCHALAGDRSIDCWVSMEQVMGCGVGACLGCAIPIVEGGGYARVCTEGPVFPSRTVKWTSP